MATATETPTVDPKREEDTTTPVPPYFAFQTLLNQLDSMKERAIPNRIDRSFLVGMSGAGQAQYITGLRSLGLIDASGAVQPKLTALVQAPVTERKRLLGEILRERYAKAVELGSTNATTGQLVELFRDEYGATGDTARKAIAFFLNAVRYAGGIPISPMFTTPKVSVGAGGRRRKQPGQIGKAEEHDNAGAITPHGGQSAIPIPEFHPTLAGVLSEFPKRGGVWTKERRDEVLRMFEMAVDFTIPIVDEEPSEDDKPEVEVEAVEENDDLQQ
jgi:hypothetical protein